MFVSIFFGKSGSKIISYKIKSFFQGFVILISLNKVCTETETETIDTNEKQPQASGRCE